MGICASKHDFVAPEHTLWVPHSPPSPRPLPRPRQRPQDQSRHKSEEPVPDKRHLAFEFKANTCEHCRGPIGRYYTATAPRFCPDCAAECTICGLTYLDPDFDAEDPIEVRPSAWCGRCRHVHDDAACNERMTFVKEYGFSSGVRRELVTERCDCFEPRLLWRPRCKHVLRGRG